MAADIPPAAPLPLSAENRGRDKSNVGSSDGLRCARADRGPDAAIVKIATSKRLLICFNSSGLFASEAALSKYPYTSS